MKKQKSLAVKILIFVLLVSLLTNIYNLAFFNLFNRNTNTNLSSKNSHGAIKFAIFYDNNYTAPWISYSEDLALLMRDTIINYSLDCSIYNGGNISDFIIDNPQGILINTMGILPYSLWNGSENSLIESWLDSGGVLFWTGCEEFYWLSYPNGTNVKYGHEGSIKVMDMEYLTVRSNQYVEPTNSGSFYIPEITSHTSDIFSSMESLEDNSIYYEAYCLNGDLADPILMQPKNGNGYLIRVHADWIDTLNAEIINNWIFSIIKNRIINTPIIKTFSSDNQVYLFEPLDINLQLFNYNHSYRYNITIKSNSFEKKEIEGLIEANQTRNLNISISFKEKTGPKSDSILVFVILNDTMNGDILYIYNRNISINIILPFQINLSFTSDDIFPGGVNELILLINNCIDIDIEISVLIFSSNYIYETYDSLIIKPGFNQIELKTNIPWITKTGNVSVKIVIYHNAKTLYTTETPLFIGSINQNPIFILFTILILLLSVVIISIFIIYKLRNKRNKEKISEELINQIIEKKSISISSYCNRNNISFKKINIFIKKLIDNNKKLKYLTKFDEDRIILYTKDEFRKYIKKYILKNDNITFSELKSRTFLEEEELEHLLKELIN
ncbi:MAG: hypothetical protein GF329_18065, partial [Candidatus Lokiarchaeota archaeon]|nr:hypothetical protein [Candidatus Lokiarchaeota archaeon]